MTLACRVTHSFSSLAALPTGGRATSQASLASLAVSDDDDDDDDDDDEDDEEEEGAASPKEGVDEEESEEELAFDWLAVASPAARMPEVSPPVKGSKPAAARRRTAAATAAPTPSCPLPQLEEALELKAVKP